MTRFVIIAACLLTLPVFTDWFVDHQFQHPDLDIGYSQTDRDGMARLIDSATRKRHQRLSGSDEQAALRRLWGDGQ